MKINNTIKTVFFFATLGLFMACGDGDSKGTDNDSVVESKRAGVNEVIIHMSSDPDKLNIITASSAGASEVQKHMFEMLLHRDPKTLKYEPRIAKSAPTVEEIELNIDGEKQIGLKYSYEIREEAKFNDGSPITGHDVAFYVKAIKNPKVDCEHIRSYLESVYEINVDEANPKNLSIIFKEKYFAAIEIANGMYIMQRSLYDVNGYMKGFTIQELTDSKNQDRLASDKNINAFAKIFNSEEFSRESILSSGPYTFKSWVTGERIILEKNDKWWGRNLSGEALFSNGPDKVTFEIIVDMTTAKTAQMDEGLDLMKHRSKDYLDLKENKNFLKKYKFETPISPSYGYIGLNTKKPQLEDKRVRQALSMAVDYETVKEVLLYGLATRTASPIHPNKSYYNNNIKLYPFDLTKASALLDEAGWVDTDGDAIRDKEIDGEDVPLKLEFKYVSGSVYGENLALLLKKNFSKIGVEVEVVSKEWTVYLEDIKSHNFDMSSMGWVMGAGLSDMKQIWHSESSQNGGSNSVSFGNAYSDELIEKIRFELDAEKRKKMYFEIQEIIHEEAPYIFMFTGKTKMAIHKRFDNAQGYGVRPGYDFTQFQLNTSFGSSVAMPTE